MIAEWPQAGLMIEANGIHVPPSPERRLSDAQRQNFRGNRYNACLEKDGKVYIQQSGGLMSNGISVLIWLTARHILGEAHYPKDTLRAGDFLHLLRLICISNYSMKDTVFSTESAKPRFAYRDTERLHRKDVQLLETGGLYCVDPCQVSLSYSG